MEQPKAKKPYPVVIAVEVELTNGELRKFTLNPNHEATPRFTALFNSLLPHIWLED